LVQCVLSIFSVCTENFILCVLIICYSVYLAFRAVCT